MNVNHDHRPSINNVPVSPNARAYKWGLRSRLVRVSFREAIGFAPEHLGPRAPVLFYVPRRVLAQVHPGRVDIYQYFV